MIEDRELQAFNFAGIPERIRPFEYFMQKTNSQSSGLRNEINEGKDYVLGILLDRDEVVWSKEVPNHDSLLLAIDRPCIGEFQIYSNDQSIVIEGDTKEDAILITEFLKKHDIPNDFFVKILYKGTGWVTIVTLFMGDAKALPEKF